MINFSRDQIKRSRQELNTFGLLYPFNAICVCRLSDWNMHGDEGLCSWPTTPVHAQFDASAASLQRSDAHSRRKDMSAVRGSMDKNNTDMTIFSAYGERLVLA